MRLRNLAAPLCLIVAAVGFAVTPTRTPQQTTTAELSAIYDAMAERTPEAEALDRERFEPFEIDIVPVTALEAAPPNLTAEPALQPPQSHADGAARYKPRFRYRRTPPALTGRCRRVYSRKRSKTSTGTSEFRPASGTAVSTTSVR